MDLACIRFVPSRHPQDCVICCLAMLLGTSYEATLLAVSKVRAHSGTEGLYWTDAKRAAKILSYTLRTYRGRWDPDHLTGILACVPTEKDPVRTHHAVLLMQGMVADSADSTLWYDAEMYLIGNRYRRGSLLIRG